MPTPPSWTSTSSTSCWSSRRNWPLGREIWRRHWNSGDNITTLWLPWWLSPTWDTSRSPFLGGNFTHFKITSHKLIFFFRLLIWLIPPEMQRNILPYFLPSFPPVLCQKSFFSCFWQCIFNRGPFFSGNFPFKGAFGQQFDRHNKHLAIRLETIDPYFNRNITFVGESRTEEQSLAVLRWEELVLLWRQQRSCGLKKT